MATAGSALLESELLLEKQRYSSSLSSVNQLEISLAKLKSEKKQLKAYALQLKAESELWVRDREEMRVLTGVFFHM